jgi:hypothetical protein
MGGGRVARVALGCAALVTLGAVLVGGPFPLELRAGILASCAGILLYLVSLEARRR